MARRLRGGWQDSGGVWPGIKLIEGQAAGPADPEWGHSRGRLLPTHQILTREEVPEEARRRLQESLVLVHGGMPQNVGPILEMVTEKYLLRSQPEWMARSETGQILDEILASLRRGDLQALGRETTRNFVGLLQTIIPWASNLYTETLIQEAEAGFRKDFWGFWMLGGMSGGGMGFIFDPKRWEEAQTRLQEIMSDARHRLRHALPFAMEPVVYDFAINERGTWAELRRGMDALLPAGYYASVLPGLVRQAPRSLSNSRRAELDAFGAACRTRPELRGMTGRLLEVLLPRADRGGGLADDLAKLLVENGFDPIQHEQIRGELRAGRVGLAHNRLPVSTVLRDVEPEA